jgi:very-short-patch-repair endonuclease
VWWDKLKPLARQKRREPTAVEDLLWQHLRDRQLNGLKFRRQYPIERFIVDFCCIGRKLIIEVDGPIHEYTVEEDALREAYLNYAGFRVIRFTNDEVLGKLTGVLARITSFASE